MEADPFTTLYCPDAGPSPGLGHIVQVGEDGMVFSLWGQLYRTPLRADDPAIRRLTRLQGLLARQRIGEAILRREAAAAQGGMRDCSPARQPLLRWWLRLTRGRLPALEALGGRIQPPGQRWLKARMVYWLGRIGAMPVRGGYLDHGVLVDRIGKPVRFEYNRQLRHLWLDRIILHRNGTIHLTGLDLGHGEPRTFRLDRLWNGMEIPPLGRVSPDDLHLQLKALCSSRKSWIWSWDRHQEQHGGPLAPPIGPVGKALSWLAKPVVFLWDFPRHTRKIRERLRADYRRGRSWLRRHLRDWKAARHPLQRGLRRYLRAGEDPACLRRLRRAIATLEAGGTEQVTCLLPMYSLRRQSPAWQSFLRFLLEQTLAEAKTATDGHPLAVEILAGSLAIPPPDGQVISPQQRQAAEALLQRLRAIEPGCRRIWVHATRRAIDDARLLVAESYLQAVYTSPGGEGFYRTQCYFVARWDNQRFRMDASSAARLRIILEWWTAGR
ncbi:hypothetical protein GCM10027256_01640 [Novispirillum itersonii subsp. nipponicum]